MLSCLSCRPRKMAVMVDKKSYYSAEHEIFPARTVSVKMQIIVGISTFMSRKISIIGLLMSI